MTRLLLLGVGYGFLGLGVIGLFLPILQGILFIVVGLLILSRHAPWAQRLLDRFRARHPRAGQIIAAAEARLESWSRRFVRFFRRRNA